MLLWKNLLKTSTGALFLSWEGISVISLSLLLRREHFHHLVLTFSPSLAFCFLPVLLTPTVSYSCSSSTCCASDTSSPAESFLASCCGVCVLLPSLLVTFAFLHSFLIPLFFSPNHMSLFPFHCIHILILRMEWVVLSVVSLRVQTTPEYFPEVFGGARWVCVYSRAHFLIETLGNFCD